MSAPPTKALPARSRTAMTRVLAERDRFETLKELSSQALFFDKDAPSTRQHRACTRANFEYFMELEYSVAPEDYSAMYDISTITERTKEFLAVYALSAEARMGRRLKASILMSRKQDLFWWIVRFIPSFYTMYLAWHLETEAYIHMIAIVEDLPTHRLKKNDLGDVELSLFYGAVLAKRSHVLDWQQHYTVWVSLYITGTRPGSITVCPGYERGAELGLGIRRTEDETLRWSDVDWIRFDNGIGVRVTLRYLKMYRRPHKRYTAETSRYFTFVPTTGTRFEFDVSVLLFALAQSRGLFQDSVEEVLNDQSPIRVNTTIAQQAVFVNVDRVENIEADQPMGESLLNIKLIL
ncbi:hypothetical protein K491DRAFT_777681 [Lophiostoma macrostomum CBS 122681]|uniref:Uncharacterized protein n=1 Tax=Lophiostoma macrostomum CBS 122681 TaxID=1314788 RepID=A0A6A6TC19_9PLEO|nr:hypothetical protein K491DRAFT_777681 [Lophiostoma macrostomum CBS 122681]